jgi:hypothetical protein
MTPDIHRRKKSAPVVNLKIQDVVRLAFVDNYVPVLVAAKDFTLDFVHVVAKLSREAYARVAVSSVTPFAATIGELALREADAADYASELAPLGLHPKLHMLRVVPKRPATEHSVRDEELALAILCALARIGDGVIYAEAAAGATAAVAFEFSLGFATPVID